MVDAEGWRRIDAAEARRAPSSETEGKFIRVGALAVAKNGERRVTTRGRARGVWGCV